MFANMEYITSTPIYPAAFTDCEASILNTINRAPGGVWNPAHSDLNFGQLRALLSLRNGGWITYAAYGGYMLKPFVYIEPKPQPAPVSDIERLNALLVANGVRTSKPVREVTAGMTVRHYSDAPSLAIYLDADTVLPTAVHEAFEPQAYSSGGRFWVVQLKKVS